MSCGITAVLLAEPEAILPHRYTALSGQAGVGTGLVSAEINCFVVLIQGIN